MVSVGWFKSAFSFHGNKKLSIHKTIIVTRVIFDNSFIIPLVNLSLITDYVLSWSRWCLIIMGVVWGRVACAIAFVCVVGVDLWLRTEVMC